MAGEKPLFPRKAHEAWFTIRLAGEAAGHEHIFWEPHGDGTAWFERRVDFTAGEERIDRKVQARFRLDASARFPQLVWLRYSSAGEDPVEIATSAKDAKSGARVIPPAPSMVPSYLVDLLAAAAPQEEGEVARLALLHEAEAEVRGGFALLCKGREEIEVGGQRFDCFRYVLEREGEQQSACYVDANRRLRRIDYGGPVAELSTRAAALGEAAGSEGGAEGGGG